MEKEFISYELAVKLKELGFDEPCLIKYGMTSKRFYDNYVCYKNSDDIYESTGVFCNDLVAAPLWQQAFDWFREKHSLPSWCFKSNKWWYKIEKGDWWYGNTYDEALETYEQSRHACLEKLIELVEKQNNG